MRTNDLRRLNFRHLHYFWTVAREQHLTRAAERLHVAQSAISAQVRQLEEALGHDLFLREGRSLQLTEVGSLVLGYADGIFGLGAELLATVKGDGETQALRVGAVATLSRNFQQNLLAPVMAEEDLHVVIESASLEELLERLRVHRLDVVLSNRPATGDDRNPLQCRRLARQSVYLVGPPGLAKGDGFCFPDDLAGLDLLVPGRGSEIRSQFDMLCQELGTTPRIWAEVDDMAMLRLMARDSGRVAVVPEVVVQDELSQGLLEEYCALPGVHETFYAITVPRHFRSEALRRLLDETRED
jgi:LysR family transcriptional activator of nhaA